ncbi:MAG: cysteine rich repeat-containing protein, partial [Xanthobacteraceae bacterium]
MAFTAAATRASAVIATLLGTILLNPAAAQQPTQAQRDAIRSSCRSDFMANCSGVQPGGKDALECLKRNLGKLSGGCQAAVSAISPAPAAAAAPAPPPA